MAIQKKRAARRTAPRQEFNPRDLLLAGVGAMSLGRKQAIRSIEDAPRTVAAFRKRVDASVKSFETKAKKFTREAEGDFVRLRKQADKDLAALRKQAAAQVASLRKQALAQVEALRKQASEQVAPLQRRFDEVVVQVANQAEARFGPVLKKIAAAKPAARPAKSSRRKVARKAA